MTQLSPHRKFEFDEKKTSDSEFPKAVEAETDHFVGVLIKGPDKIKRKMKQFLFCSGAKKVDVSTFTDKMKDNMPRICKSVQKLVCD